MGSNTHRPCITSIANKDKKPAYLKSFVAIFTPRSLPTLLIIYISPLEVTISTTMLVMGAPKLLISQLSKYFLIVSFSCPMLIL
jgi:hypothetical protein